MYNTFKTKEKLLYTKNAKRKKQGKYSIKNKNKEKERMNNTTPKTFIIATKTKISTVKDIHKETTITITKVILNYLVFLDHSFK